MSDSLKVECPHCGGSLKLKDRSADGKRVRCPKCQEAFKVELPDEDLDIVDDDLEDDLGDDFGGDDELPEEEEPPRRSKGGAAKKPVKKKRKSGSGAFPWLLIAAGLALVVVLGGVGVVVSSLMNGGNAGANKIDFTYLPADTNLVVQLKVSEMFGSPLLADTMNQPASQQMLNMLTQQTGMSVKDMTSVTIGSVVDETDSQLKLPQGGLFGVQPAAARAQPRTVTVVRSTVPLKAQEIGVTLLKGQAVTQNGQTYYQGFAPTPSSPLAGATLWFPESNVMVFGTSADVVGMTQTPGLKQSRRREFDFINPNMTVMMAMALKLRNNPSAEIKSPASAPQLQALERAANKTFRGGMMGCRISDRVDLEIIMQCSDSSGAGEMKSTTDALIADLKKQFEQQKGVLSLFDMKEVADLGDKAFASFNVSQSGTLVTATGTIPNELKAVLDKFSKRMPGGMAGMPGAGRARPGAFPPSGASGLNPQLPPPGIDPSQIPPGAIPGTLPPGTQLPGGVAPGNIPPGLVPPGTIPPGTVPPGAVPPAVPPK